MAFVKYVLRSGKFEKYAFLYAAQDRKVITGVRLRMGNLNTVKFTLLFSNFVQFMSLCRFNFLYVGMGDLI